MGLNTSASLFPGISRHPGIYHFHSPTLGNGKRVGKCNIQPSTCFCVEPFFKQINHNYKKCTPSCKHYYPKCFARKKSIVILTFKALKSVLQKFSVCLFSSSLFSGENLVPRMFLATHIYCREYLVSVLFLDKKFSDMKIQ